MFWTALGNAFPKCRGRLHENPKIFHRRRSRWSPSWLKLARACELADITCRAWLLRLATRTYMYADTSPRLSEQLSTWPTSGRGRHHPQTSRTDKTLAAYCWQHLAEVVAPLPRKGLLRVSLAPAAAAGKQFGHVGLICNGGEDLDLVHQASEVPTFNHQSVCRAHVARGHRD